MRPASTGRAPSQEIAFAGSAADVAQLDARLTGLYARTGKRALDLLFFLAVAPFAVAIGAPVVVWNLAVFRDVRRVFFVQRRVGRGGRVFRMIKFRTMRDAPVGAAESWFSGGDVARVTRFGRFLRNSHLDELPQLVNVLRGDMHVVGPRPEMPDIHAWASGEVPGFEQRLAVRPGLTGLAQVTQGYTGASAACYAEKLAIDLAYLRGLSLRGDLGVLARTVPWVLRGRGWAWKRGAVRPSDEGTAESSPTIDTADALTPRGTAVRTPVGRDLVEADA